MTPMKEDYLKIIFELGGTKKKVSNKQIALSLDIAAGSVTEMVGKLVQEGLAKHTPYAGISLTKKGIRYAETLVRKHRIWEDFLVDKLDYALPDVHTEAEVLEHVTSERLVDSLESYLDHPTHCPHGGAIPDKDGHYQEDSHTALADAEDGSDVVIERFIDNHDLLVYLHDIDLQIGQSVQVLKHDPFEGPVTIVVQPTGQQIPVSYKAAHNIFVK